MSPLQLPLDNQVAAYSSMTTCCLPRLRRAAMRSQPAPRALVPLAQLWLCLCLRYSLAVCLLLPVPASATGCLPLPLSVCLFLCRPASASASGWLCPLLAALNQPGLQVVRAASWTTTRYSRWVRTRTVCSIPNARHLAVLRVQLWQVIEQLQTAARARGKGKRTVNRQRSALEALQLEPAGECTARLLLAASVFLPS